MHEISERRNNVLPSAVISAIIGLTLLQSPDLKAQQMIIDDAAVTTTRSIQLESWYGAEESWIIPAFSPVKGLELSIGFAFDSPNNMAFDGWALESKYIFRDLEEDGSAYGLVGGIFFHDGSQEFYLYAPYSASILSDNVVIHLNAGIAAESHDDWSYSLISGIGSEISLTDRFTLLGEVVTGNFDTILLHGGIKIGLIPDLLEMDVTWGRGLSTGNRYPGFNIGFSLTPDRLW